VIPLKPQTARGGFALVALLLAGTATGRALGIGFDQALYLSVLVLIGCAWLGNRFLLKRVEPPTHEPETDA
jgi:hypothetical protein